MHVRTFKLIALLLLLSLVRMGPLLAQGPEKAAGMLKNGYDLMEAKKYDQAQKVFEELLRQDPGNPLALNNLAAILVEKGRYQEALAHLKQALPRAKGQRVRIEGLCNVGELCAVYRATDSPFGSEDLEELIKVNLVVVQIKAAAAGEKKK